ncbi:MAG: toll/interleukin-1 receptor domain-containing protein [Chitinophagaceae bacterium]|nr:toll/interleukin-1 receptor domain-containing protein [Chitinophagaceae bacterium]
MDTQIGNIIADIQKESCVLIVGPDIVDFGEKTFFELLCEEIINDKEAGSMIDNAPGHIFRNEELLQLLPVAKESTVMRPMERFYKRQAALDEPLAKIAQIPFHLVISLMPDHRLPGLYQSQNLPYSYSHYRWEQAPEQVEKPTAAKPLIYNLLGDFNDRDVIITFDHFFDFLASILGDKKLPNPIQEAFKKASTFVFLGVHFEKWSVQLLLRIIAPKEKYDKNEKYSILQNGVRNDVCTFIARRLDLNFLPDEPHAFLDQLYEACRRQNMLKTVSARQVAKVFVSYSHRDSEMISTLKEAFSNTGIELVFDEKDMSGGQPIDDFINTIRDVDIVMPLLSASSLSSPWVSREIMTTLEKTNKHLYPCSLDDTFLDKDFISRASEMVDEKIADIDERIKARGKANTNDLFHERSNWSDYYENLPRVINELAKRKVVSLNGLPTAAIMAGIIEDIRKLMKKE